MSRHSQLQSLLVAAMVALSMVGMAAPAGAAETSTETSPINAAEPIETEETPIQTLEDGDDLYFIFGAGNQSVDEFIEAHATDSAELTADQDAISEIVQYQDVESVNLNQQGGAVSIGIDGGSATAVQESNAHNANSQTGEVTTENTLAEPSETFFENVGDVHIVFGTDNDQSFDGWGIANESDEVATPGVEQSDEMTLTQDQDVDQVNFNAQSTSIAVAENGSKAVAYQESTQRNQNTQEGSTTLFGGADADVTTDQSQTVSQANTNQQGTAIAIAIGNDSSATAVQMTEQTNLNEQVASVSALAAMSGMNVATAGTDESSVLTMGSDSEIVSGLPMDGDGENGSSQTIDGNSESSSTTTTDGDGDGATILNGDGDGEDAEETSDNEDDKTKHDKKKKKDAEDGDHPGGDDGDDQDGSGLAQYQSAEQLNINLQSTAVAIATGESNATAIQLAEQRNYNQQLGSMELTDGSQATDFEVGTVLTNETTLTIGGDDIQGDARITLDYDGGNAQLADADQYSTAHLEQIQFVSQENRNQQQAAVAVATDNGTADASQITVQENRNVQSGVSETSTTGEVGANAADGSEGDAATDSTRDGTGDGAVDDTEAPGDATDGAEDSVETSQAESDTGSDDDSNPGFGVAVALVAVLAAALLATREQN